MVAPPLDIRPPPAAELEPPGEWPASDVGIDPAFRQALAELEAILDRLEAVGDEWLAPARSAELARGE